MQAWEQILRDAISKDYDEQQMALFRIGLVLQRHNPHITPDSDVYEEALSRGLLRLALNEQRQRDTVIYLATMVRHQPKHADSFLFAMSNAQPKILIEPLVELLVDIGEKFGGAAAYQALVAFNNALRDGDDSVREVVKQQADNLIALLDDWSSAKDNLLSEKALNLADKVETMIDSGSD